jgi:site-specific DNA-methyltransferase (cytosine-N4-specific)
MARPKVRNPRDSFVTVRLTAHERGEMEKTGIRLGFASLSGYLRSLHQMNEKAKQQLPTRTKVYRYRAPKTFYRSRLGTMLHGDALGYFFGSAARKSVDLIMTSPPFGLVSKKTYGNEDAHRYCDWFRPFAEGFRRVLKDDGRGMSRLFVEH